jgi:RNA polymerase sigma-70 factor (ECF subfamily)
MEDLPGIERSVADAAPRPDQAAQLSELAAQIERALEAIPESRRRVVRMYLVGYNSTEIGALMGWSEAKARNLLYRGLGDLRERLADVGVGPGPQ